MPLTVIDEAILHLERASTPWNIQVEVGAAERLDEGRLSAAVRATCARHPLLRSRLQAFSPLDRRYRWQVEPADAELDLHPVRVVDCPDEATLAKIRTELYSPEIPLDTTPPLRVVLARRSDRDLVMVATSHVPTDGMSVLRLVRTLVRSYRGEEDPEDPVPLAEARDLSALGARSLGERVDRALEGARKLGEALSSPSRIADADVVDRDGFGHVHARLTAEQTGRLVAGRPSGVSVNDVLLAALHLTVQRWNDARGTSTERVGLLMPVNLRPPAWSTEVVGNYASFVTVSTDPEDRADLGTAARAVAQQTGDLRRAARAGGLKDLMDLVNPLPLGLKRVMPKLLPATGDRFVDSAVLSNLGRAVPHPSFVAEGAEDPDDAELWFSPPARMPMGVGIGVVSTASRLHLVLRHQYRRLGPEAGQDFLDLFTTTLAEPLT